MAFLVIEPELVEAAAHDLAGIRTMLGEATAGAAAPTTGVMAAGADEVSAAIAGLFGNFGQEFQAIAAQASAFHDQFVSLLRSGAGTYLSTEVASAQQVVTHAIGAPAETLLGDAVAGQAPALLSGLNGFGATVAAPYQALVSNTAANLQSLGGAIAANPAPFLNQFLTNQVAYGQTIVTGLQDLPAEVANLPATLQSLLSANPLPALHQFVSNEIGSAHLIASSLQNAGNDFVTGVAAIPANLQTAFQTIMSGDVTGGLLQVGGAFLDPIYSGLNVSMDPVTGLLLITPGGALGDLLPIAGIPAQMAQNFTNLIPANTIPAMVAQNATHLLGTVTDLSQTLDLGSGNLHVGLPLVLALDALGSPVTTLQAIGSSASSFIGAVQTGDGLGALASVIDAPAVVANGFLNGQATLSLPSFLGGSGGLETITTIPLGGILTAPENASLTIPVFGSGSALLTGTQFGGILPGLLEFLPGQLAQAIGAPPTV